MKRDVALRTKRRGDILDFFLNMSCRLVGPIRDIRHLQIYFSSLIRYTRRNRRYVSIITRVWCALL